MPEPLHLPMGHPFRQFIGWLPGWGARDAGYCHPIMRGVLLPDFKEFSRLARQHTMVPVVKSVTADLLTPVSAFLAIADNESEAFLLESVERGEQIGRYTFLGVRPYMKMEASGGRICVTRGKRHKERQGTAVEALKELLQAHRPATLPGLPPFTAGAVGYFAYDSVRQLEKIGEQAKDDLDLPDCVLMFFDRLLAFDHLRHQIHIIATADVAHEQPKHAYDRAVHDIERLEKKLSTRRFPTSRGVKTHGKLKIHAGTSHEDFWKTVERSREYIDA